MTELTPQTRVSDIAAAAPATIRVFQQYGIDFCCGGRRPLADAAAEHRLDVDQLLGDLARSLEVQSHALDWRQAPLVELIAHIQTRFHHPLRDELPRLSAMLDKVVSRHGDHYPAMLLPLQDEFQGLMHELLTHMDKEDRILFPAIAEAELSDGLVAMMEHEHALAGSALARMRQLTSGYQCPAGACPTFTGLFWGLEELERDMHVHIHLENNILFPRALSL